MRSVPLKRELIKAANGIRVGDRVRGLDGHVWTVDSARMWSLEENRIQYRGSRIKRDGGPGKTRGPIYVTPSMEDNL